MICALIEHQGKAQGLANILLEAGHQIAVPDEKNSINLDTVDVMFGHTDEPSHANDLQILEMFAKQGKPVYLYPHSALPSVEYDGLRSASAVVTKKLVTGPGHVQVLRQFYPRPVYELGWFYCPLVPFEPVTEPKRILFAPMHPWADGKTLLPQNRRLNSHIFSELANSEYELTVRYFGDIEANGLEPVDGVTFVETGPLDNTWADIDNTDLVVATGTYAYLAAARGKPLVMFGQDAHGIADDGKTMVDHWPDYSGFIRYPLDYLDYPLWLLVEKACAGGKWLEDWKRLFIGKQATTGSLGGLLGELPRPNRAQRRAKSKRKGKTLSRR